MRLIKHSLKPATRTGTARTGLPEEVREVVAIPTRPEEFGELPYVKDVIASIESKWPFARLSLQPITVNYALIAEHGSPVRQYYVVGLIDHITDAERGELLAHFPIFKIDYAHLRAVASGEVDESGN